MKPKVALVLSAGGMFGAWQAGAWRALEHKFHPDLVVGASVGSLNGYVIASGASADELCEFWLQPELANLRKLPGVTQHLMERYPLASMKREYALVLTDIVRFKPRTFSAPDITWRHLAASCSIPGIMPPYRIGGRFYADGGLLNPLPVWAAVELGATDVVLALHALPEIPPSLLKPLIRGFRWAAGHHPPLPEGVRLRTIQPPAGLGSVSDALRWKRSNVERWIEQGFEAAKNISL